MTDFYKKAQEAPNTMNLGFAAVEQLKRIADALTVLSKTQQAQSIIQQIFGDKK